jgi:hypothetical protein
MTISNAEGLKDVHVTAFVGTEITRPQHYTLQWDDKRKEFVEPECLLSSFKREYRDFKLSKMTMQEIFALLVKTNRRRKSTERKVYKLRDKIRRINDDAMTAIGSRQRTIEEQWEVMRELVRRGLVKADDMQRVICEVTKTPPIKLPGRMTDDITLGTKERLYTDILLDIAGHERTLEAYERMLRDGTLPEDVCRRIIAAQKKMLEDLREELEKRREEEKEDGV